MIEGRGARVVRYTRRGVADGLREGWPLALGVFPWGIAFGIAAQSAMTDVQAMTMSVYLYSGTAQFVALGMWQEPIALLPLLIAVFAVNARYLLQGLTLAPWLQQLPRWQRWGTLYFLYDGSWAASLRRFEEGYDDVGYLLGSCGAVYIAWVASTLAGLAIPTQLIDTATWGLDFAVTAAVVALAGTRWSGLASVLPWTVAALVAFACLRWLPGSWYMFVGGLGGAIAGALWEGRRDAD